MVIDGLTRGSIKHDKVERRVVYRPPTLISDKRYGDPSVIVIGWLKDCRITGGLSVRYEGYGWLFVDSLTVAVDEWRWKSGKLKFSRDVVSGGGRIRESTYLSFDNPVAAGLAKRIAAGNSVTVRFHGSMDYDDLELPNYMQEDLRAVLKAREAIKG